MDDKCPIPGCGGYLDWEYAGVDEGVLFVCTKCGYRTRPFFSADRILNLILAYRL